MHRIDLRIWRSLPWVESVPRSCCRTCNSKAMQIHLDVIAGKLRPKPAKPPTLGRHLL